MMNLMAAEKKPRTLRQNVAIPEPLAKELRRVAKERRLTLGRALVALAEKGVQADRDAEKNLRISYRRFVKATDDTTKGKAGKDLIRAVFGKDAIAEDPVQ
jgi:hypothetical protein